ncbi:uncharacterized protein LOC110990775 [Acanthaster planci]|uniref:Uncharacterized protein LOC110990775 n=1 Tax=Acanthaster planci TaxID=133434 RepID=A0A8B8A1E4_ACAPL|nr:uncharacterized protein LOC110990775 [Acanthaster planci]
MASCMMGTNNRILGYARDRYLPKQTSASSFPVLIDDVEGKDIEPLMTRYFNGGVDATCAGEKQPLTCPVITANWFAMDKLAGNVRAMSRAVMIPFVRTSRKSGHLQSTAELERSHIEERASHALPSLISLGKSITENSLTILSDYRAKVKSATKGMDCEDRIFLCYGLLLFLTEALIDKARLENVAVEAAEIHLREVIVPHAIRRYQALPDVDHEFASLASQGHVLDIPSVIMKLIEAAPVGRLLMAINPRVELKLEDRASLGLAFHLNELISIMDEHSIQHPGKVVWRSAIKKDNMVVSKVQAFFNTDPEHVTISRSRLNTTKPKNRLSTFIHVERFSVEQRRRLEEVFKVQIFTKDGKPGEARSQSDNEEPRSQSHLKEAGDTPDIEEARSQLDPVEAITQPDLVEARSHPDLGKVRSQLDIEEVRPQSHIVEARTQPDLEEVRSQSDTVEARSQPDMDETRSQPDLENAKSQPHQEDARPTPDLGEARSHPDNGRIRKRKVISKSKAQRQLYEEQVPQGRRRRSTRDRVAAEAAEDLAEPFEDKTNLEVSSESICHKCLRYNRRATRKDKSKLIRWIACGRCPKWFHQECVGVKVTDEEAADFDFLCPLCAL